MDEPCYPKAWRCLHYNKGGGPVHILRQGPKRNGHPQRLYVLARVAAIWRMWNGTKMGINHQLLGRFPARRGNADTTTLGKPATSYREPASLKGTPRLTYKNTGTKYTASTVIPTPTERTYFRGDAPISHLRSQTAPQTSGDSCITITGWRARLVPHRTQAGGTFPLPTPA